MGLLVNESKTKTIASHPPGKRAPNVGQNLTIGESNFEVVTNFKYLGSYAKKEMEGLWRRSLEKAKAR